MKPASPPIVNDVFAEVHQHLVALLKSLDAADWDRPTMLSRWSVKDVAAHLLDGDLRRLSFDRDRHPIPDAGVRIETPDDLKELINRLNVEWVELARRFSPALLVELLEMAGARVASYFAGLDPEAPAAFAVSWAGEMESQVGLDVAREYTEKWVHQQQIREAVGRELLDDRRYLHPVLATFVHALPPAFAAVAADTGTRVSLVIEGPAGGEWVLCREDEGWPSGLYEAAPGEADPVTARARIDQDTAWRLFSTRKRKTELRGQAVLEGDQDLARTVLDAVAVVA